MILAWLTLLTDCTGGFILCVFVSEAVWQGQLSSRMLPDGLTVMRCCWKCLLWQRWLRGSLFSVGCGWMDAVTDFTSVPAIFSSFLGLFSLSLWRRDRDASAIHRLSNLHRCGDFQYTCSRQLSSLSGIQCSLLPCDSGVSAQRLHPSNGCITTFLSREAFCQNIVSSLIVSPERDIHVSSSLV